MKSFLTGSQVYGTPREDSDIDLVVLLSSEDMYTLELQADENSSAYYGLYETASLRFGKLNLICVTKEHQFQAWQDSTNELKARKPVTREEAVDVIKAKLEKYDNIPPLSNDIIKPDTYYLYLQNWNRKDINDDSEHKDGYTLHLTPEQCSKYIDIHSNFSRFKEGLCKLTQVSEETYNHVRYSNTYGVHYNGHN